MQPYPEVVTAIANDYLDRVKTQLHAVPTREQFEFLRETELSIYEAYQRMPGESEAARILGVLRKLGEPAEVVAERLPGAMVGSGTRRSMPLYIVGGILIALFGIPLGFGGLAVLAGICFALAGAVVSYYAAMGAFLVAALALAGLGLIRIYATGFWDRLVQAGFIHYDPKIAQLTEAMPATVEGILYLGAATLCLAAGITMMWGGRYMVRGIRFLYTLLFDSLRRGSQSIRRKGRQLRAEGFSPANAFHARGPIPL